MDADHISIENITDKNLAEASDVVAEAYYNNPLAAYAFKGLSDSARLARVRRVHHAALRSYMHYGKTFGVRRGGRVVAACAAVPPNPPGIRLVRWASRATGVLTVGVTAATRYAIYDRIVSFHKPSIPHWHLYFLGVTESFKGQGLGTELVTHICKLADRDRVPMFLEVALPEHVAFYQTHNFEVISKTDVPACGDMQMWAMLRQPQPLTRPA